MRLLELLLTFTASALAGSPEDGWLQQAFRSPHFDTTTAKNVTALVGKTAHLHCKVKRLNNKTVSWIRSRDLHILTAGTDTYTNDARFQVARDSARNDWTLMIKFAQESDSGAYECQISTQPLIAYPVHLKVVLPESRILGGADMYINRGSLINLTCVVTNSPEPPAYIFWYHGDKVISYESARGGVSVVTEKGDVTTSHLLIRGAQPSDSGVYSCAPSNARIATIIVHVLQGETPAAMHTSDGWTRQPALDLILVILQLLWQFGT